MNSASSICLVAAAMLSGVVAATILARRLLPSIPTLMPFRQRDDVGASIVKGVERPVVTRQDRAHQWRLPRVVSTLVHETISTIMVSTSLTFAA
jgi:hypothetical protein